MKPRYRLTGVWYPWGGNNFGNVFLPHTDTIWLWVIGERAYELEEVLL